MSEERPEAEDVIESLRDIPVRPPAWRATAAEVTARGRRRHRRLQAVRAGAGLVSIVAVVGLAAGLANGGEGTDVVPAGPSALASGAPSPSPTAEAITSGPDRATAGPSTRPRVSAPRTSSSSGAAVAAEPAKDPQMADGKSTVFITDADIDKRELTFDLVQFLTGDAAVKAWREKYPDDQYGTPPNDYFIVNENLRLRTLPVADDVKVTLVHMATDSNSDSEPGTFDELPDYLDKSGGLARMHNGERDGSPYAITVVGGVVTRIDEIFVP